MINVNLNSVFYMTQEVIPNMIHNKKDCIINMSSIWGQIGASCEHTTVLVKQELMQ